MRKSHLDPKVKKILVRNSESKLRQPLKQTVVREVALHASSSAPARISQKENELVQPTLCSSAALGDYISDIKKSLPPPLSLEDLDAHKDKLSIEVTKKLNFHINDRIYKNLVALNTDIEDIKLKKDKKLRTTCMKRDLEPNIEDFYQDDTECDSPPEIPIIKTKFKSIKHVGDGDLHQLVASFEVL